MIPAIGKMYRPKDLIANGWAPYRSRAAVVTWLMANGGVKLGHHTITISGTALRKLLDIKEDA